LPVFKHHVFVCHNVRPEGAPRTSCTSDGKSELHAQLQQLAKAADLGSTVRINKSGCLDQCEHGPTVVVYPEAVWYGNVTRRRLSTSIWSEGGPWSVCGLPMDA